MEDIPVNTRRWFLIVLLLAPLVFVSCRGGKEVAPAGGQYPVKGKVTSVDASKPAVKLDHEEIPGLMKAMEMEYAVENSKMLEGIKAGDQVQGQLKVEDGKYTITQLEKQ
jgi:protein SCO1/2